jgi:uncharacterized protein
VTDADNVAVADASPLIALEQVGHLWVLGGMFGRLLLPPYVASEVAPTIPSPPPWLERWDRIDDPAAFVGLEGLDPGEREAIAVARVEQARYVLLDDRPARRRAEALGFTVIGALGLLVRAKRLGRIARVKPLADEMRSHGFYASSVVYRAVLARAGESLDEVD